MLPLFPYISNESKNTTNRNLNKDLNDAFDFCKRYDSKLWNRDMIYK